MPAVNRRTAYGNKIDSRELPSSQGWLVGGVREKPLLDSMPREISRYNTKQESYIRDLTQNDFGSKPISIVDGGNDYLTKGVEGVKEDVVYDFEVRTDSHTKPDVNTDPKIDTRGFNPDFHYDFDPIIKPELKPIIPIDVPWPRRKQKKKRSYPTKKKKKYAERKFKTLDLLGNKKKRNPGKSLKGLSYL
jgi:hypothetical protein